MHLLASAGLVSALLLLVPSLGAAQALDLRLREEATETPLRGVLVRLMQGDRVVAQGLTNEIGRILLPVSRGGTYTLRVDRIGFTTAHLGAIELTATDTVRRQHTVASLPRVLPAVTVIGTSQCGALASGGELVLQLWDEIHKALSATGLTERDWEIPLHYRTFERHTLPDGVITRQWTDTSRMVRGPGSAAPPAAELATHGFVRQEGGSLRYSGPDAWLLLSEEFIATHCFRAAVGDGTVVGLQFQPVPGRQIPDIAGTLWLDRVTSELKYLEFTYTGLPRHLPPAAAGGRVEFSRLDSGAWIVSAWHLRMPRFQVDSGPGGTALRLAGYRDRGGRAEPATLPWKPDRAVLIGHALDEHGGALAGAVVAVRGVPDSAFTDSTGGFRLEVDAAGERLVEVRHPKVSVGEFGGRLDVVLSLGDTTHVELIAPPLAVLVRQHCGAHRERAGIIGVARGPSGTSPVGLPVQAAWRTGTGDVRVQWVQTGTGGVFAFCGLPPDLPITVSVRIGEAIAAEHVLHLEQAEYRWVELAWTSGIGNTLIHRARATSASAAM